MEPLHPLPYSLHGLHTDFTFLTLELLGSGQCHTPVTLLLEPFVLLRMSLNSSGHRKNVIPLQTISPQYLGFPT
jgi:hypothetical protein